MSEIDIFSQKPQLGEFFYFKEVGDSISGTYIDVRDAVDQFGNNQAIYVLKDGSGKVWNVGINKTKAFIHEKMRSVRFGQIVGFRFDERRPNKKSGMRPFNVINVYSDPNAVDHEWLKQQTIVENRYSAPLQKSEELMEANDGAVHNSRPVQANIPKVEAPMDAVLESIYTLAGGKGIVAPGMNDAEMNSAIEGVTGLPIMEENYTKIIVAITTYKKQ